MFFELFKEFQKQEVNKRVSDIRQTFEDNWWTSIGDDFDYTEMYEEITEAFPEADFNEIVLRFKIAQDGMISDYILKEYMMMDVDKMSVPEKTYLMGCKKFVTLFLLLMS